MQSPAERDMTHVRRGPTEEERRAIQQAVDAGDLTRAEDLLSGVRRRLAKSNQSKRRSARSAVAKAEANKEENAKPRSNRSKNGSEVRTVGRARLARCPVCRHEHSVNMDGRLRVHRDVARKAKCPGSGAKVAKAWKTANRGNSIRAVSGGLPSLGKRR